MFVVVFYILLNIASAFASYDKHATKLATGRPCPEQLLAAVGQFVDSLATFPPVECKVAGQIFAIDTLLGKSTSWVFLTTDRRFTVKFTPSEYAEHERTEYWLTQFLQARGYEESPKFRLAPTSVSLPQALLREVPAMDRYASGFTVTVKAYFKGIPHRVSSPSHQGSLATARERIQSYFSDEAFERFLKEKRVPLSLLRYPLEPDLDASNAILDLAGEWRFIDF